MDEDQGALRSIFTRAQWAGLGGDAPLRLAAHELEALRATGEPLSIEEVEQVYLPLTRLISLHLGASRRLAQVTDRFLGRRSADRPYVVAIAGSVAVGKSTVARVLRTLLSRQPDHPHVDLVATDGFIYPRAYLQSANLMTRKGFPESYDVRRMIGFLADIRATGRGSLPVYSHQAYDQLPGELQHVDRPDILIFEGLNVLQLGVGREGNPLPPNTASDFFDLSIYVDAEADDIERWYVNRFQLLSRTAFANPASYFHHLAGQPDPEIAAFAEGLWHGVNRPNLERNILPTRARADVVIHKAADHSADRLELRRF